MIPFDSSKQSPIILRALSCDTITQVKKKLLDTIYSNEPFSTRLSVDQFYLGNELKLLNDINNFGEKTDSRVLRFHDFFSLKN